MSDEGVLKVALSVFPPRMNAKTGMVSDPLCALDVGRQLMPEEPVEAQRAAGEQAVSVLSARGDIDCVLVDGFGKHWYCRAV